MGSNYSVGKGFVVVRPELSPEKVPVDVVLLSGVVNTKRAIRDV